MGHSDERKHRPGIVHKALSHPVRLDILLRLYEQGPMSPAKYCETEELKLSVAAYHFKVLLQHEAIVPDETVARGVALVEHLYAIDRNSLLGGFLGSPRNADESERQGGEEHPNAST